MVETILWLDRNLDRPTTKPNRHRDGLKGTVKVKSGGRAGDMAQAASGTLETSAQPRSKERVLKLHEKGEPKRVEIELRTETQLLGDTESTQRRTDTSKFIEYYRR